MTSPGLSPEYSKRIAKLQERMDRNRLDGLLLTRRGSIAYIAGVWAPWRTAVILTKGGDASLLTSKNDLARVAAETWIDATDSWLRSRERPFPDTVSDRLDAENLGDGRVGVEMGNATDVGVLTAYEYQAIEGRLPGVELIDATAAVNEVMVVKEPGEIENLRRANEICDVGIEAALDVLEPGISEIEVAGAMEYAQRKAGSEYNWSVTRTEVGSGYKQARPNGFTPEPTDKLVQRGDLVTLDVHSVYNGYYGDLATNAVVGEPTEEQLALEDAFQSVVETLLGTLGPHASIGEVVERTDQAMRDTGLPGEFVSYYGHGLGTTARSGPTIVPEAEGELEPNTTLVAHAYICDPDVGGMRLETPVLITEDGVERLSKIPLELLRADGR